MSLDSKTPEGPQKFSLKFKIIIFSLLFFTFGYFVYYGILIERHNFDSIAIPLVITVAIFIGLCYFFTVDVIKGKAFSKITENIKLVNNYKDENKLPDYNSEENHVDAKTITLYPSIWVNLGITLTSIGVYVLFFLLFNECHRACRSESFFIPGMYAQIIFILVVVACLITAVLYIVTWHKLIPALKNLFFRKPSIILSGKKIKLHSTFPQEQCKDQYVFWNDVDKINKEYAYKLGRYGGKSLNKYITVYLKNGGAFIISPSMMSMSKQNFLNLLKNYPVKVE